MTARSGRSGGAGELLPRERVEVAPGAVHVPDWLDLDQQRRLFEAYVEWADGPVAPHSPLIRGGRPMSVQLLCLGWHWLPYRYSRTAENAGGAQVLALPDWLADLGRAAVATAYEDPAYEAAGPEYAFPGSEYRPDTALVNRYDATAKMGMHQDRDERSDAPVVSLSLGDTCVFRFGNTEHRNRPYVDVELRSGDLFVFGGPSRFAYHGVTKTLPGTGDPDTGWTSGRLNVTMRETGLS